MVGSYGHMERLVINMQYMS